MSFSSTVLVYEFFTGGGAPAGPLPPGLAAEALGMLWALLTDFRSLSVRTITAFDSRFEHHISGLGRRTLPADEVVRAFPGDYQNVYLSLLGRCDAVLIIAPETNGILSELTSLAETAGKFLLGSSASAVARAGDKMESSRIFHRAKLPDPKTRIVSFASAPRVAARMGFPLIVKPIDGVGSEGVCRVENASGLLPILQAVRQATSHKRVILQEFVEGIPVSVSLLAAKGRALPLSLNRQLVEPGARFQYLGSRIPFHHQALEHATGLACAAVRAIAGLRGYVGVDLILKDDCARLIEINPRLTTSYIGLRQVSRRNLAQAIWDTCEKGILPDPIPIIGEVVIKKDDPGTWGFSAS